MRQALGLWRWHFRRSSKGYLHGPRKAKWGTTSGLGLKDLGARTFTVKSCKKSRKPSGAGLDREKANLNRREAVDLGRG